MGWLKKFVKKAKSNLSLKSLKRAVTGVSRKDERRARVAADLAKVEEAKALEVADPAGVGVDAKPIEMPTMDAAAVEEARRLALLKQQQRGGRASTFLSNPY